MTIDDLWEALAESVYNADPTDEDARIPGLELAGAGPDAQLHVSIQSMGKILRWAAENREDALSVARRTGAFD